MKHTYNLIAMLLLVTWLFTASLLGWWNMLPVSVFATWMWYSVRSIDRVNDGIEY